MSFRVCTSTLSRLMAKAGAALLLLGMANHASAQQIINLYTESIPNAKLQKQAIVEAPGTPANGMVQHVVIPTLEAYLPEQGKATGTAVIICPGGSYKVLTYQAEGVRTAKEMSKHGIAAFVLKYRLPDDSTMVDKKTGPLQDAQQAIKLVRESAAKWNIDVRKVGIMGFSAGGHLASTVATHFSTAIVPDPSRANLRPDFVVLVYPVISMQNGLTHPDSRNNLLGKNPTKETIDLFSNELQVTTNTPPTYLTHAGDDKLVDVDNSIAFYEVLRHHNVPAELHLYPKGGHGFVLGQNPDDWMAPLFKWMNKAGF